ncbi:sensor histidine kinase [Microbacterium sp. SSM24]|uniref:sensor histidine kinase n=1 Tax=Microbacterium sp. SSM24 TaxID=2991714 RepID=UPI002225E3F0|nr:HAMP domain-containing sensor histidine kinase [Microbacterium sp. SSM24]MCW3493335.1 HAMP domain-containing histidine kinase [Microbacterium sp. SSM24]
MTDRRDAAIQADRARVQRSAMRTGLWVGLAAAAVVVLLTTTTIAVLVASSRSEEHPPRDEHGPRGDRIIDLDDAIPITVLLGVIGVVALGFVAWYLTRRAAQPLAEALEVQRNFVADASHELRTPLTTLTSRIQLAEHRVRRGEDVDDVLHDMRGDAAVMDAVLTDLLVSAESAGASAVDADAVVAVAEVAREAAAVLQPRAAAAGVTIVVDAPDQLRAAASRVPVLRALTALLDNAVRYAPPGSQVTVTAVVAGGDVAIRVTDAGPGISGIDPSRMFDRFARTDVSVRPGAPRGFGLGLALVRDVAMRFGGSIAVERSGPEGTTFLLVLPSHR